MAKRVVDVLVPVALDRAYSYRVPETLSLAVGDIVSVPLGAREATAVVWAENPQPNPRFDNRLKDVEGKLDLPPLKDELRGFVDWVANYTVSSRGMVLRMCLRMGEHLPAERERVGVRLAGPPPQRKTAARERLLALLADGMVRGKAEAAREAGVSAGVVDGLVDEGTLETVVLPPEKAAEQPDPDFITIDFAAGQAAAAAELKATVAKGGYSVTLVDGVTGSGKTEVYFEAVADMIRAGRQSLILMPEIALTAQFLDRFSARFGVRPAEWHSELSPRKRARTWRGVAEGNVPVVVGARSALFLPYADLGLIVVDEEHDQAYKQEDGVHYHARDMAVVRGHVAQIPVMLVVGDAVAGDRSECAPRPLPAARVAGTFRRPAHALGRGDRSHPRAAADRPLHRADTRGRGADRDRARRAGAVLSQPPRLRAADLVPGLRLPLLLPELRCLAGRSSLSQASRLSSLRFRHAASGRLSALPGGEFFCCDRARRRASGRGSARAVSAGALACAVQRSGRHGGAFARRT